jgi:Protein of unknown function (DUF2442)
VLLSNGLELAIPLKLAPRLALERASDLEHIEVSPAGLVLYWPKLEADLYLPTLLTGAFGTLQRRWLTYWAEWPHPQSRQPTAR